MIGQTISHYRILKKLGEGDMGVDGHGGLHVAYYSYEPTISPFLRLIVARTRNVDLGFHYSVVTPVFLTAGDWTTYHNGYSLSANPLNSTVAIAWTDNRYGDYDILLSTSKDGGETWSTPSRINDDRIQNGVLQDKIWTNYSVDGKLSIIWRDRRHGGTGDSVAADIYGVISTDTGHSFSKNYRLSTKSAPYEPIPCCNSFISVKTIGTTLYAIWADDRYSDLDVFFSKMNFGLPSNIAESDNKTNNITFNTFPNPANEKISMRIGAFAHEEVTITIYNLLGQRVFINESMKLRDNEQTIDIDIRNLSTGTYILVIEGKCIFAQKRFNVIK